MSGYDKQKKGRSKMTKARLVGVCLTVLFAGLLLFSGPAGAKSVYIGGTMSLTGPYAEDSAAVLL